MQCLQLTLDREIALLERLVECTQTEQQQLLALEAQDLEYTIHEKQRLLDNLNAHVLVRNSEVFDAFARMGIAADEPSLSALVDATPSGVAMELACRRDRIQALTEALRELNAAAGFFAQQKLKWIRSCRKAIEVENPDDGQYGPSGRIDDSVPNGRRLNASV
jgi:flagellar biosynthesis/type III secretory pathway chaperone